MTFHEGEITVQSRAGVRIMAERIGRGIQPVMPLIAQNFLHKQTLAAASSVDSSGAVWASLLTGAPGFINAQDAQTLHIAARPMAADPLSANLYTNPQLGLVAIDFASRSRVRINGTATLQPDGIQLHVQQAYSNCPKYIQARSIETAFQTTPSTASHTDQITAAQADVIAQADTFFIASYHTDGGADASHRGGNPGFIHVVKNKCLEFPDYSGNMMFNTLGNLEVYPHAGLLFLDFQHGTLLQLTGRTEVIWDEARLAPFAGAERLIIFHIEQVIEHANALPFHFRLHQYSPYNPK